jgi:hypothetical protein
MKEEIERALQPLVGEPLCGMFRFVGIQAFEFGVHRPCENRRGEDVFRADLRLHVSCFWRVTDPAGFDLSRDDFEPVGSRRDEKAYLFYGMLQSNPPFVQAIKADEEGALHLQMSHGYTLDIRPDEMEEEPDEEQWRFLPKDEDQHHLVITLQGIER